MVALAPSIAVPVAGTAMLPISSGKQPIQERSLAMRSSLVFRIRAKPGRLVNELQGLQKRTVQYERNTARASEEGGSAAGAGGDSIVSEVALLEEEPETPGVSSAVATKELKRPGALQRGGTLSGKEALGKDPSVATVGKKSGDWQPGAFEDPRWTKGTWDLTTFTRNGRVNWDGVIDAEVKRRKWLEENPEASSNNEPVVFESSIIPWWAWVKRFHLPEAELLNGRAAMVGYVAAYLVDSATGAGLVEQQSSFLGKLLLFITVVGVLLIRKNEDLDTFKTLAKESTFYDKQWQATWKEDTKEGKPSE